MKKSIYCLGLTALLNIFPVFASGELVDRIVAKVGSEAIFLSDLEKAVLASKMSKMTPSREEILQQMIDRALLVQEAKKLKIIPSDSAVKLDAKRQLVQIRSPFRSETELQQALKKEGLTLATLEEQFIRRAKEDHMIRSLIRRKTQPINLDKVNQFIANQPEKAKQIDRVRLRHIFFACPTTASEIDRAMVVEKANLALSKLRSGERWEEVVQEFSDDVATKNDAGDLGFMAHGDSLPEIETIAFSLPENKISDLIRTETGYHIIQVIEKETVALYLENEALKKTHDSLIQQLRSTTDIIINP